MRPSTIYDFGCPYCGSPNSISIDVTGQSRQSFITDCEICCRPIAVNLLLEGDQIVSSTVQTE